MSAKRGREEPGPAERQELLIEEQRADRAERRSHVEADAAGEDDGEATVSEMLELDQTELEELGLTLDDPHQPDDD